MKLCCNKEFMNGQSNIVPNSGDLAPDDPDRTIPLPRYNTMLAVLRNTLYMYDLSLDGCMFQLMFSRYGGIFERGSREYTLDDFHSIQLDKLDRFTCLKQAVVTIPGEGEEEESSSDEDDEDEDSEDDDEDDDGSTLFDGDGEEDMPKVKITLEVVDENEVTATGEKVVEIDDEEIEVRKRANSCTPCAHYPTG